MTIKEIRSILEKYIKIFHVCHEIFRQPENFFSQSRKGSHDAMLLVLEIRKLKLDHHSAHLPKFHGEIGHLNLLTSNAYFGLKMFDKAKFHLTMAEEIMKVVYGEDHPYMQECQKSKMELRFAHILKRTYIKVLCLCHGNLAE